MGGINWELLTHSTPRILAHGKERRPETPYLNLPRSTSYGTGFFIGRRTLLSCCHVIEAADQVEIELPQIGSQRFPTRVVAICPELDLAVLRVEAKLGRREPRPLPLATEAECPAELGSACCVIGYGFGSVLTNCKIVKGVVSGQEDGMYQLDAPINPGNSGGPVVYRGKVIGIATSAIQAAQNIGFACPIFMFLRIAPLLLRKSGGGDEAAVRIVRYPKTIGFVCQNTPPGLGVDGLRVVSSFGDAKRQGLRDGDIIVKVDEHPVNRFGQIDGTWLNQRRTLWDHLRTRDLGSTVTLEWVRAGRLHVGTVPFLPCLSGQRIFLPQYIAHPFRIIAGMVLCPMLEAFRHLLPQLRSFRDYVVALPVPGSSLERYFPVTAAPVALKRLNGHRVRRMCDLEAALDALLRGGAQPRRLVFELRSKHLLAVALSPREVAEDEALACQVGYEAHPCFLPLRAFGLVSPAVL